jgi:DNA repair protein RecO (recombination protein O)
MILTTEAIVLKTMKYRESSIIATLYTRDHGKMSVIARGIRNNPRVFGSSLEAMNRVRVVVYTRPTRELQLLTQCDFIRSSRGLVENLKKMACAMAMVELANLATPPEEKNVDFYELLADSLESLNDATRWHENTLYYYEVHLLELAGFRPELCRCSSCGTSVESLGLAEEGVRFIACPSGVVCAHCASGIGGEVSIGLAGMKALGVFQAMSHAEPVLRVSLATAAGREIATLLRHLVRHHITGMRPLKSEQVFAMLED